MVQQDVVKDNIFDFIIEMAFNDTTMRNAFPNPFKEKSGEAQKDERDAFNSLKDELKESIKQPIKDFFYKLLSEEDLKDNDIFVWECIKNVLEKADEVCNKHKWQAKIKGEKKLQFTFGHAQKVVNMSAKYLFISCYAEPNLRDRFQFCHCPMDKYMIKGVLDGREKSESVLTNSTAWSGLKLKKTNKKDDIEEFIKKAVPDEYIQFQGIVDELRGEYIPLEYDYIYWPTFAEKFGEE